MDPLSDVLSLLKPRSYASGGYEMGSELAVSFPKHPGVKCYAMLAGRCWLSVEGVAEAALMTAGDCFLLPRGLPFCMATDLALTPVDYRAVPGGWRTSRPAAPQEGGSNYLVGGHFALSGGPADVLLKSLPPIVHIRREADKEAMRWSLERMREELSRPQPGSSLMTQQLAYMMLVQALRLHLADGPRADAGWLFGLTDPQIGAALGGMHDDPGHAWTLQTLAERVGMSRSVFAAKFKQTVGTTPMEYLTRWRMLLAGDRLRDRGASISTISSALGYESESAFGKAFRRVMGCSPRQHSRGNKAGVEGGDAARAAMAAASIYPFETLTEQ